MPRNTGEGLNGDKGGEEEIWNSNVIGRSKIKLLSCKWMLGPQRLEEDNLEQKLPGPPGRGLGHRANSPLLGRK